jgi:hypothetical protein
MRERLEHHDFRAAGAGTTDTQGATRV